MRWICLLIGMFTLLKLNSKCAQWSAFALFPDKIETKRQSAASEVTSPQTCIKVAQGEDNRSVVPKVGRCDGMVGCWIGYLAIWKRDMRLRWYMSICTMQNFRAVCNDTMLNPPRYTHGPEANRRIPLAGAPISHTSQIRQSLPLYCE